ncbi:MAG TPA: hypothetical protein VK012_06690, partial [Gemmatimonadales bacterium]|nr:hypothetical protein [Gemmatimonadales bacterium]
MSLTLRCKCGRTLKVADEVIGRSIRCRCGRVLKVRGVRRSGPRTVPERLRDVRRGLRGWLGTPVREGVRRVLWRISLAYLGGAIVAWPFLFGLGDRWWPATVLLFGPRWVLLLPLAVLVPAALALLPRALLLLLVGGLIVAGPVMGFSLGWQSLLAGDDAGDIRIVSFNAQSGAALGGPGAAETALLEWDADIVALQECPHEAIFDATREMP